jgi:polyhydroxyalkanoate synthesis repressor PhaR
MAGKAKQGAQARNAAAPLGSDDNPITIKKYANRRLYNTATSSYVTLDHLCQMVKDDVAFAVYDAKSGEEITRPVLTQIIVEEEAKGANLLPINFLRQLISLYGDSMQWVVPRYLEHMMDIFSANQDRMRKSMQDTFGGMFPFPDVEAMNKQNMAMFEQALKMFTPFGPAAEGDQAAGGGAGEGAQGDDAAGADQLTALKTQLDLLQRQLDSLSNDKQKD